MEYYSTRGFSALALVDVRCQAQVMSLIASYLWTPQCLHHYFGLHLLVFYELSSILTKIVFSSRF